MEYALIFYDVQLILAPMPLPPLPAPHRCPREGDTRRHCCPHAGCHDRGWRGRGKLRATAHPRGGPFKGEVF
jgi:hypothetical protein